MKIIHTNTESGHMIVKKDNMIYMGYVYQLHNGCDLDDCIEYLFEQEEDDDLIKIDISNGFKIKHWHDLYQYNCCSSNEYYLKELCKHFKRNDLLEKLDNPLSSEEDIISNFNHFEHENYQSIRKFSFNVKNRKVQGQISFIKYILLDHDYYTELNLDELVSFHISLNKVLSKLVKECNRNDFSSLENWAVEDY